MRIYLQILVLVLVIFCVAEAKRKEKWAKKSKLDHHHDKWNAMAKHGEHGDGSHYYKKKYKNKNRGGMPMSHRKKMKHHKKGKHGYKKKYSWLNFNKDCDLKCKHGEICISGPVATKPFCVRKADLRKSMKLFRRYQMKEKKAWKKFQKEKYGADNDDKHADQTRRIALLKADYIKMDDKKTDLKTHLAMATLPDPVEQNDECLTSQFAQMRSRLMGWFHLLHGQDHLAKKAHGGNIKHFYKHVSVKKELREHNGNKCECLKSAMWQFHQMDKNGDDSLSPEELAILGENSMEPCLKPYLTSCDMNADQQFSSNEWCCCFSNVVAPCFKKVDEIRRSGEPVVYMPRCDKEGYYMREQCSGDSEDTYQCWCVDYNGNEYKDTRKHGRAHCTKIAMYGADMTPMI